MSKYVVRTMLGLLLVGAAMFATLGEAETSGTGSSAGDKPAESSQPASTQQNPIPLGTDVEVAKGWNLKVNSANLDGNALAAEANMFNTPAPGTQYILVNVTITNNSGEPASPLFEMKLSALPPSGVAADPAFVAELPGQLDTTAQMQPGAAMTGVIPFEVPTAEVIGTVLLGQSQFTLDENKDQKFFALQ